VEPQKAECLFVVVPAGETYQCAFEVIRGGIITYCMLLLHASRWHSFSRHTHTRTGLLDIQLRILGPSGKLIMERMAFFKHDDDARLAAEGVFLFVSVFVCLCVCELLFNHCLVINDVKTL